MRGEKNTHRTNLLFHYPQGQTWQKHQCDDSKVCDVHLQKEELWEELEGDNAMERKFSRSPWWPLMCFCGVCFDVNRQVDGALLPPAVITRMKPSIRDILYKQRCSAFHLISTHALQDEHTNTHRISHDIWNQHHFIAHCLLAAMHYGITSNTASIGSPPGFGAENLFTVRIYVRFGSCLYVIPRQITQSRAVDQKDDFLSLIGRYILLTQAVASIHHIANERSGSQMSSIWKMYNKVSSSVTEVALSPWSLMVRYGFNRWNWTRWKDVFQSKTLQQKARASTRIIRLKKRCTWALTREMKNAIYQNHNKFYHY